MADHDISVALDPQNKVVVQDEQLSKSNRTVRWITNAGALEIRFKGTTSPFVSGNLIIPGPGGLTADETTKKFGAKKRRFPYTAEVTTPAGGVFSKDPDLIIDDGGGGGPKKKTAKKKTAKKKAKK